MTSNLSRHCSLSCTGLVTVLFILIELTGRCAAQSNFVVTVVPIIFIASIIACSCCFVCCLCIFHAKTNASKYPQTTEISYNEQPSYHTHTAYPHSQLQGYVPPTARVLYPPQEEQNTSQADAAASEPVPLPDAILHQGDAPPGYEEAVRMTAASNLDQPEQQSQL